MKRSAAAPFGLALAMALGAGMALAQDGAPAGPTAVPPSSAAAPASPAPAGVPPVVVDAPAMAPASPAASPAAPGAPSPVLAQPAPAPTAAPSSTPIAPGAGAPVPDPVNAPADLVPPEAAAPGTNQDLPHDLSPWGMFMAADMVVKGVMIGLLLASVITWTVWLAKTLELFGAKARLRRTLRAVQTSTSLAEAARALEGRRGAGVRLVQAARQEVARADKVIDFAANSGLKERVSSRLHRIEIGAGRRLGFGTGILASIGSVSPFVGLFGTVWGIMNSFIGISQAQSSSLAVVAPGIAEALLATAMGLVAAIPAVIFYNIFARSITGYRQQLGDLAAAVERLVSSDLDHRFVARNHPGVLPVAAE